MIKHGTAVKRPWRVSQDSRSDPTDSTASKKSVRGIPHSLQMRSRSDGAHSLSYESRSCTYLLLRPMSFAKVRPEMARVSLWERMYRLMRLPKSLTSILVRFPVMIVTFS
jgi:hypothetical protein